MASATLPGFFFSGADDAAEVVFGNGQQVRVGGHNTFDHFIDKIFRFIQKLFHNRYLLQYTSNPNLG